MFQIDFHNFSRNTSPELKIELIGSFSIDSESRYHADLSQMKYYIPPSDYNNVCYNLDYNAKSTHHKPDSYVKLDDILEWMSDNFTQLEKPLSVDKEQWLDVNFVCRRGALTKIFASLYEKRAGWIIYASKYRGTIYMCEFYTVEENKRHINKLNDKLYSRGYKFEQYMTADHPSHEPNLSVPLNECEKFHCMFKTKLGNHSLLYEAEIDAVSSQQAIKDTLIGKKFKFIELKTIPWYRLSNGVFTNTVLKWWSQNYLTGIDTIICGVKDENTVKNIKEYSTDMLPHLSKVPCDVDKCKMFCKMFLDNVKKIVTKDHNECMYKFHWNPVHRNIVHYSEEPCNNEMYLFLKPSFINKAERHKFNVDVNI